MAKAVTDQPADRRPTDEDELARLWCELWEGYQELLAEERATPECDSKDSE